MRLHLFQDQKIINRTISFFEEVFPGENIFVVFLDSRHTDGIYVKNNPDHNVFCVHYNQKAFWDIVGDINSYESIIVHFLYGDAISFLNLISHPNIYWIEWGADLYQGLLERKGYKIYRDKKNMLVCTFQKIPYPLSIIYDIFRREILYYRMNKAIKKCRYFVPDSTPDEYQLLLDYYPKYSFLTLKQFFYYPIQEILGPLYGETCNGDAIFVGNSCSFSNNHTYIFDKLLSAGITNRIIVPLSYSGSQKYRELVLTYGTRCFGEKFYPLLDFMPLNEYNKVFLTARSFVFANLRQEAVGNMIIAMYLGGRLFLEKDNPMYNYYVNLGLCLNSIDDLSVDLVNKPLSFEEIENNRLILGRMYSDNRMKELIRTTFMASIKRP